MFSKFIILLLILNSINANDLNTTIKSHNNLTYININSNAKNTMIYLDGKLIGKTPICQYEVMHNKDIKLKAKIDKNYFLKDIEATIKIKQKTIPTINLTFEKAKGEIFLVGEDGELYINNKFIKKLKSHNRNIILDAQKNLIIKIKNGYKEIVLAQDILANSFTEIKYKLIEIPLDIRLYALSIDNLMWEDTKEASNSAITWEKAFDYCKALDLGKYDDWEIPTIEQLELLYENNKDDLYNGFGGEFYWSSNRFKDKTKIWDYAKVKDFTEGKTKKSIIEFEKGRIRCVRNIIDENIELDKIKLKEKAE